MKNESKQYVELVTAIQNMNKDFEDEQVKTLVAFTATAITAATADVVHKIDSLEKSMNSKIDHLRVDMNDKIELLSNDMNNKIDRLSTTVDKVEKSLFKSQLIFGTLLVLLFLGSQGILDVIFPGIFPVK